MILMCWFSKTILEHTAQAITTTALLRALIFCLNPELLASAWATRKSQETGSQKAQSRNQYLFASMTDILQMRHPRPLECLWPYGKRNTPF